MRRGDAAVECPYELREADVRATYRVVMESLDAGYDPVEWRRQFLKGIGPIIDADLCHSLMMPIDPNVDGFKIPLMVFHSHTPGADARQKRFFELQDVPSDPLTPHIMQTWPEPLTVPASAFIPNDIWKKLPHVQRIYEPCDVNDFVHSRVPVHAAGYMSVLGLSRRKDQPLFTAREARIVEIAHTELVARIAIPSEEMSDLFYKLPTRLQELATHLRGPKSEKEIAEEMRLSAHTVHNYVKRLYKRLNVVTRAEAVHLLKSRDGRAKLRHELVLS